MTRNKKSTQNELSVIDAVETLACIADLDFDKEVGNSREQDIFVQNQIVTRKAVEWLHEEDSDKTVSLIQDTFRVVLNYLKHFYKNDYRKRGSQKTLDGIKMIMVLVGEAAKKLDLYTTLFQNAHFNSVTDLREYKALQSFYNKKISRKIDEALLGRWILGLAEQTMVQQKSARTEYEKTTRTRQIFIDLESVKRDTEYELFLIRKEDGTRFFSPRLIRNVKLISDFGSNIGKVKQDDPLISVKMWYDTVLQEASVEILRSLQEPINRYYTVCKDEHQRNICVAINKCLMSLMLSANPKHLLKNVPLKCCQEYFFDFLTFLREGLTSQDYQKMMAYNSKREGKVNRTILRLIHGFCKTLYTKLSHYDLLIPKIEGLIAEAKNLQSPEHQKAVHNSGKIWNLLAFEYQALKKLMKNHSGGPLVKVLETLEAGKVLSFAPLRQGNLPAKNFDLYLGDQIIANLRIPSPTYQQYINKAHVIEEFKGFIWDNLHNEQAACHLLFNLQDRTSWKEHFRAKALEDLSGNQEFNGSIVTVTLAKDTEFYTQSAPFDAASGASDFIENFKQQLQDENAGFYFPESIRNELFSGFIDSLLNKIHQMFFLGKNVLQKSQRLAFIEIAYIFIQLKIIDLLKPNSFSLTCKDGIDVGAEASCQLWVFCNLLKNKPYRITDIQHIHLLLFAPSLLIRERLPIEERFNRMIAVIRCLETVKEEMGNEPFFKEIHQLSDELFSKGFLQDIDVTTA